jgi:hypothetical protein
MCPSLNMEEARALLEVRKVVAQASGKRLSLREIW